MKTPKARNYLCIASLLTVGFLVTIYCPKIFAAQSGITVSPASVNLTILKNENTKTTSIKITNNYLVDLKIDLEIKNSDLNNNVKTQNTSYQQAITDAITVYPATFNIQPKKTQTVDIKITNSEKLGPGGNYASLIISQNSSQNAEIGINSKVLVNIFIVKEKGATWQMSASNLIMNRFMFSQPKSISLDFINTGNVQIIPRGVVLTGNSKQSDIYQKGVINEGSLPVLPGSQLKFEIPLTTLKDNWLPQKNSLSVQYRFDGSSDINNLSMQYWFVPNAFCLVVIIVLACFTIIVIKLSRIRSKSRIATSKIPVKLKNKKVLISDIKQ